MNIRLCSFETGLPPCLSVTCPQGKAGFTNDLFLLFFWTSVLVATAAQTAARLHTFAATMVPLRTQPV